MSEHPPRDMHAVLGAELDALAHARLRRTIRTVRQRRAGTVLVDGDRVADFASSDYLGLATDPRVARAASAVLESEGTGAGASRLITGTHPVHVALEEELARFKQSERALLFPSGYMANVGAIPALVGPDDVIYADARNHASLTDGARLSSATVRTIPHLDIDALAQQLQHDAGRFRRSLFVVEGVFSMDGDLYPLDRLVPLARQWNAWTYVDDAHGTGIVGDQGRGVLEQFQVAGHIDVVVGTLGKAFGTCGAYVAGSETLIEYLRNRAHSFVYTTSTPPALAAATLEAILLAQREPWRRQAVHDRARRLRMRLTTAGFDLAGPTDGHIITVQIGDPVRTMQIVGNMRARGFLIGGVRPPTVPDGTSRVRITISAAHPPDLVDALAANLLDVINSTPLP